MHRPLKRERFARVGSGILAFTLPVELWFPGSVSSPTGVVSKPAVFQAGYYCRSARPRCGMSSESLTGLGLPTERLGCECWCYHGSKYSRLPLPVKDLFAIMFIMSPITIQDYCAHKGKPIELSSTERNPNLFTADNAKFVHRFSYREVDCVVLVPYKGEGLKRFWNKLLRYVREYKKREDDLWEHGLPEDLWHKWKEERCS